MFNIKFKIVDDNYEKYRNIDINEFDEVYGDIEGLFQLTFEGNQIGFYDDDFPFGQEWIVNWLEHLLLIITKIRETGYLAYRLPETRNLWLEFVIKEKTILVSLVEDVDRRELTNLFSLKPLQEFKYGNWSKVEIPILGFKKEVISKTNEFLTQIKELNPEFLRSKTITQLIRLRDRCLHLP
ncbi:hypothetical protein [Brevibacillus choshinensis]|uniref:hypothetical protein n=1 Tax=Brevibacillus choshinensis TaxID=54911 RepID=UPI002E23DD98|nr:hypothetical protein [Brevibacillus choshinensis]